MADYITYETPLVSGDSIAEIDWEDNGPMFVLSGRTRRNQEALSGWDMLLALEAVAERCLCLGVSGYDTTYSKTPSSSKVLALRDKIREMQATGLIVLDASVPYDKVLTNYTEGANPGTYFSGFIMPEGYGSRSYWEEIANCVANSKFDTDLWVYGFWPLLRVGLTHIARNVSIGTPVLGTDIVKTNVFLSVQTSGSGSIGKGLLYRHAGCFYRDEYQIERDWWEHKYELVAPPQFDNRQYSVAFPTFGVGTSSSAVWADYYDNNSTIWVILKIRRGTVDWDAFGQDEDVVKYVWMKWPIGGHWTYDYDYDMNYEMLYYLAQHVSTALSLAGITDDVTHPSQSQIDAHPYVDSLLLDILEVSIVAAFPNMEFDNSNYWN